MPSIKKLLTREKVTNLFIYSDGKSVNIMSFECHFVID